MRISRRKRLKPSGPFFRINERIRAEEVRVIDENEEHLGVLSTADALRMARERGLDLIEINPAAAPPIAKFLNYGQFKYQKEKESRLMRAHQKKIEIKGIRLSLRIGKHDLEMRQEQAKRFLEEGDKARIEIILRGRERQHADLARKIIQDFAAGLGDVRIEQPISQQAGVLSMIVAKK